MSNVFNEFDKIYYINLEERTDRKIEFEKELAKFNIKAERWNATKIPVEESNKVTKSGIPANFESDYFYSLDKNYLDKVTASRRSCALSHIHILTEAKLLNYNNVLIFEDDAGLYDNIDIASELGMVFQELKSIEWDVFLLGCYPITPLSKKTNLLYKVDQFSLTHAMLVNKSFYEKIAGFSFMYCSAIDHYYSYLSSSNQAKVYTLDHPLSYQRKSHSDIEHLITNDRPIETMINDYKDKI